MFDSIALTLDYESANHQPSAAVAALAKATADEIIAELLQWRTAEDVYHAATEEGFGRSMRSLRAAMAIHTRVEDLRSAHAAEAAKTVLRRFGQPLLPSAVVDAAGLQVAGVLSAPQRLIAQSSDAELAALLRALPGTDLEAEFAAAGTAVERAGLLGAVGIGPIVLACARVNSRRTSVPNSSRLVWLRVASRCARDAAIVLGAQLGYDGALSFVPRGRRTTLAMMQAQSDELQRLRGA